MRKIYECILILILFLVADVAFSQRIISPVPGTWSNKQSLILNTCDGSECFYSYSGTDPLTSGFAYDGPVLIDETGDVTVRVVSVKGDKKEELSVTFTVQESENTYAADTVENAFVSKICENPMIVYSLGTGSNRYCSADHIRLYQGNTLTVSTGQGSMTAVEFVTKNS